MKCDIHEFPLGLVSTLLGECFRAAFYQESQSKSTKKTEYRDLYSNSLAFYKGQLCKDNIFNTLLFSILLTHARTPVDDSSVAAQNPKTFETFGVFKVISKATMGFLGNLIVCKKLMKSSVQFLNLK